METEKDFIKLIGGGEKYTELISLTEDNELRVTMRNFILSAQTPKQFVMTKPSRGGKTVRYVTHGYVERTLNIAFGIGNWSFEVEPVSITNSDIVVKGTLKVWNDKTTVTKQQFGGAAIVSNVPLGDRYKAAGSDALKKCASLLGIAGDLYGQSLEVDTEEEVDEKPGLNYEKTKEAVDALVTSYLNGEDVKDRITKALNLLKDSGFNDLLLRVKEINK